MNRHLTLASALALAALSAGCSAGKDLPRADARIREIHVLLNAGKCVEIFAMAGESFGPLSGWRPVCELLRSRLGKFQSAQRTGWNEMYATKKGHMLAVEYTSRFERGQAIERFTFTLSDEKLLLEGYHVNSDLLAPQMPGSADTSPDNAVTNES